MRVSLENSDTVHSILKDSTKFKTSTMYSKVFISPDRTPEERIEHNELVREMKSKIQSDSSKHWKINKGKVVSVEIETPEVIAEQETSVKIESPEEKAIAACKDPHAKPHACTQDSRAGNSCKDREP